MYICWQKNADRFFSNDKDVIVQSNGDIHAIDTNSPFTAAATNIRVVSTLAEAAAWVRDGTTSGVAVI